MIRWLPIGLALVLSAAPALASFSIVAHVRSSGSSGYTTMAITDHESAQAFLVGNRGTHLGNLVEQIYPPPGTTSPFRDRFLLL